MSVVGIGFETYCYLCGLSIARPISLSENIVILPANMRFDTSKVSDKVKSDVDYSITVLSEPTIGSQLRITAPDSKNLAIIAFNSQWDCLLLGAILDCEIMFNLQSDKPIEKAEESKYINVTNYCFHGLLHGIHNLSDSDEVWINQNYNRARTLLDNDLFSTAVHAMASYRWHSLPCVQLAIIWSGIEALFKIESEISFRLSLYVSKFLSNGDKTEEKNWFKKVKELYNSRSSAVHGGKIKKDPNMLVSDSAVILNRLIRKCSETGHVPEVDKLIF